MIIILLAAAALSVIAEGDGWFNRCHHLGRCCLLECCLGVYQEGRVEALQPLKPENITQPDGPCSSMVMLMRLTQKNWCFQISSCLAGDVVPGADACLLHGVSKIEVKPVLQGSLSQLEKM